MKLHDFLVEHAKLPLPHLDERNTEDGADISECEVGLPQREWKARHAVRDDALVQKLCQTLSNILGDTPSAAGDENYLLPRFSQKLQSGVEDPAGVTYPNKHHVHFVPSSRRRNLG
jgi:hypothetical protein